MTAAAREWDGLVGQVAAVGLAGFLSTLGIGIVRGTAATVVSGGGAIVGLVILVALGLGALCQVLAVLLLVFAARCEPVPVPAAGTALWTLLLGSVGMIALNTVLVSGPVFFPPFGPVSVLLLCLPYPMAFLLLTRRGRRTNCTVLVVALVLAAGAVPLHRVQEHLAARTWFDAHPDVDRDLLKGMDWPGGQQGAFDVGPHGVRVTLFFQDSTIDGVPDAVVTVAPATTDPCSRLSVVVDGGSSYADDTSDQTGEAGTVPVSGCTPVGADAWKVSGEDFTGYAVRRDGVLLTVTEDGNRHDDLAAVAATLHPLDDHTLWPRLSNRFTWTWWLS